MRSFWKHGPRPSPVSSHGQQRKRPADEMGWWANGRADLDGLPLPGWRPERAMLRLVSMSMGICLLLSGLLMVACGPNSQTGEGKVKATPTTAVPTVSQTTDNSPFGRQVSLTIDHSNIYAATADGDVYAFQAADGKRLWQQRIEGSASEMPLISNGIVYVSSFVGQNGPGYLTALRTSDGTRLWVYRSNSYIYDPVVQNDRVYIAQQQDGISALHTQDGKQLWHFQGTTEGSPLLGDGLLYTATGQNSQEDGVYALRLENGSTAWHYATSAGTSLSLHDGMLYLCCSGGSFVALEATHGQLSWKQAIDTTFIQAPSFFNGVIYFLGTKFSLETPTANVAGPLSLLADVGALLEHAFQASARLPLKEGKSTVYALRMSDGRILWQKMLNPKQNDFGGSSQMASGIIYANTIISNQSGNAGVISALRSSDGTVIWSKTLANESFAISMDATALYSVSDTNTEAFALRLQDGIQLWSSPIEGSVYEPPVLSRETLYLGTNSGMIYALQSGKGTVNWKYQTNISG